ALQLAGAPTEHPLRMAAARADRTHGLPYLEEVSHEGRTHLAVTLRGIEPPGIDHPLVRVLLLVAPQAQGFEVRVELVPEPRVCLVVDLRRAAVALPALARPTAAVEDTRANLFP